MATYQTIHHPPEGEILAGSAHRTAPECPCNPEMTTEHRRSAPRGNATYTVVAHYWHHKLPEKQKNSVADMEAAERAWVEYVRPQKQRLFYEAERAAWINNWLRGHARTEEDNS